MITYQYYIQYHNADRLGYLPTAKTDFEVNIDLISLDSTVKYKHQIYTSKKLVEKAVGQYCFLIVGRTERVKKYYLWSYFRIDDYTLNEDKYYNVNGTGADIQKPILLNDLDNFTSFIRFCGNFGLGFQNIDKHIFCTTLLSLIDQKEYISLVIPPNLNDEGDLSKRIMLLNEKMKNIHPKKIRTTVGEILRKDKEIVSLLKKIAKYKCQFPNCDALVMKADGTNYVEVAHVMPVSYGGQSVLGNIIVLCPNHHKEFDHGVLNIEVQTENLIQGKLNGKIFKIETK